MRLEVRLAFGHSKYPSEEECALGHALHLTLYKKGKLFVDRFGEGTDHGSVYTQFEFLKRDYKKAMQIIADALREHSVEHLATITEKPPLSTYKITRPDYRRRSPVKDAAPPTYLVGNAKRSLRKGPARRLYSGRWCGHGRNTYAVFDVVAGGEKSFRVRLPESDDEEWNPPFVLAVAKGKKFPLYDLREHTANVYSEKYRHLEPRLKGYFRCPKCAAQTFHLAVGFEIPSDSEGPNDTSWFTLAAECANCRWTDLIYDDETH